MLDMKARQMRRFQRKLLQAGYRSPGGLRDENLKKTFRRLPKKGLSWVMSLTMLVSMFPNFSEVANAANDLNSDNDDTAYTEGDKEANTETVQPSEDGGRLNVTIHFDSNVKKSAKTKAKDTWMTSLPHRTMPSIPFP